MATLTGVFTVSRAPCGAPVYVTEMSTWEGNGFPDPVTGIACDTEVMRFERKPDGPEHRDADVEYWVTVSNVSGAFMRIFND